MTPPAPCAWPFWGMNGIEILPAKQADLNELAVLLERYREFYKQEKAPEVAKEFLQNRLQKGDSTIFVAAKEGSLVGFVQLYPLLDSLKLGNLWLLNDLFVDKLLRGQGISKMLLDRAKELVRATNATGLLLETQKTNKIGNSLYPSQGWKLDEEFNYYFWTSDSFNRGGETGLFKRPPA